MIGKPERGPVHLAPSPAGATRDGLQSGSAVMGLYSARAQR
jgi:hypothetical protein